MLSDNNIKIADLFDEMAAKIEANPAPIIGQRISATSDGSGPVIGMKVSVTAMPGQTGPVIGNYVSVSTGSGADTKLAAEMRDAATQLRNGTAPPTWIRSIVERLGTVSSTVAGGLALEALKKLTGL